MDRPTVIRARIGQATLVGKPAAHIEELRREYYASRAHDYLRELLSSDSAPTPDQRRELAALLLDGDGARAAA